MLRFSSCTARRSRRPGKNALHREAIIAKPYDRSIDRAMGSHKGRSRIVSVVILAAGLLLVLALYLGQGSRRVVEAAGTLRIGDDSASVLASMGAPAVRCEAGPLVHLHDALPHGTARPVADETIDRLRRGTRARWVWGEEASCAPVSGTAEAGIGSDGRVLWVVPEHGAEPIRAP